MATKEVGFVLDLETLRMQSELEDEIEDSSINPGVRSSIFSLGKDPRVSKAPQLSSPDLRFIEVLKDGLDNLFLRLNWRMPRFDVDIGSITGFEIYRRRFSKDEMEEEQRSYSSRAYDRLSNKISRRGKFSAEKKSVYHIRRSLLSKDVLNPNLSDLEKKERARYNSFLGEVSSNVRFNDSLREEPSVSWEGEFETLFNSKKYEKISTVDYSKFLAKEKSKFLFVKERDFVDLTFDDKKVALGEAFEYYIKAISNKSDRKSLSSNPVRVFVIDVTPIDPPKISGKRYDDRIEIATKMDPNDSISRVVFFRKSEIEYLFQEIASVSNVNDSIMITDTTVEYGTSYTYRAISENIYGVWSEPEEVKIPGVRKISSPLKIPIITAIQDQNSDFVKIVISANDSNVSYYELKRRDLTIYEKKFRVPQKIIGEFPVRVPVYGSEGWESNKFFVNKNRETIKTTDEKSLLNKKIEGEEIIFIDDTVSSNHIYQYRISGQDLFGNISSYSFATIKATKKKSIRTPVNVKSTVLRNFPFRVRLSWKDDNLSTLFSEGELFEGKSSIDKDSSKYLYRVQRRRIGEKVYETFPLTANQYIIDEIPSSDALDFQAEKKEDTSTTLPDVQLTDSSVQLNIDDDQQLSRPFNIPDFLQENVDYYYRVAVVSFDGDESNYTEEFKVSVLSSLSNPIGFKAKIENIKVRPIVVKLTWSIEETKVRGDYFLIEKKTDNPIDSFEVLGRAYIENEFFDRDVEIGDNYIYRIKAVDTIGRETNFFETRLTT